jgi:hypothetical protein
VILKKKHISLFPNFPWYKHGEIAHGSPRLTSLLDKGAPPFYWQSEQYALTSWIPRWSFTLDQTLVVNRQMQRRWTADSWT